MGLIANNATELDETTNVTEVNILLCYRYNIKNIDVHIYVTCTWWPLGRTEKSKQLRVMGLIANNATELDETTNVTEVTFW